MEAALLELELSLPPAGSRHIRRSLRDQLRTAILDGRLAPGIRLPAERSLAAALGISRNTVVSVYKFLTNEGLIQTRVGAGTFIAPTVRRSGLPKASARPDGDWINPVWTDQPGPDPPFPSDIAYDFRLGFPDISTFPFDVWQRLYGRALRSYAQNAPQYPEPAGRQALREAIAVHASLTRAIACGAGNIIVTSGAQQAFDLLARVLITHRRAVVAVEYPGYPFARHAFAAAGAQIVPVPVDKEGIMVDRLPRSAALIYVTPSHQFPYSVTMSPRRRRALLDFASERAALIVEDDYDGEFRFLGGPLDALQTLDTENRVLYVGTFSKSMFPSVRLGYIVAPEWAHAALARARRTSDGGSSVIEQEALASFIGEGHLGQHVRRMRKIYDQRRVALLDALHKHCRGLLEPVSTACGLQLAVYARRRWNMNRLLEKAAENGIAISSLSRYAIKSAHAAPGLALGFGLIATEQIEPGIAALSRLLRA